LKFSSPQDSSSELAKNWRKGSSSRQEKMSAERVKLKLAFRKSVLIRPVGDEIFAPTPNFEMPRQ
jgi:hypothetical protein